MKLKKLLEEYLTSIKNPWPDPKVEGSKVIDVFVNPTKKELKDFSVGSYVRFIVDYKNKKFYVFSAMAVHIPVLKTLGIERSSIGIGKNYMTDVGTVTQEGRVKLSSRFSIAKDLTRFKRKWLKKYLDCV